MDISVIITTYNQEKYIAQAIESVLMQQYCSEYEIVIGNDCSTDKIKKQYELLSKNKKALLCFNDIYLKYNNRDGLKEHLKKSKKKLKNKITFEELVKYGNPIANFSCCMYRKESLKYIPESYWENNENADWLFNLYLLDVADKIYLIIKAINNYNKLFNYKYSKIFMKYLARIIKT